MWYDKYVADATVEDLRNTFQRGYKLGAALYLGLPITAFARIKYVDLGEFNTDFMENTGLDYIPYKDLNEYLNNQPVPEWAATEFPTLFGK